MAQKYIYIVESEVHDTANNRHLIYTPAHFISKTQAKEFFRGLYNDIIQNGSTASRLIEMPTIKSQLYTGYVMKYDYIRNDGCPVVARLKIQPTNDK
jgi:hypothetical protein